MRLPEIQEGRPRNGPANLERAHTNDNAQSTRPLPAEAIAHAHAVLVSTPSGKYARRLYLSLHAADKAMERARARGQEAACVMVELVPVPGVPVIVVGGGDR